MIIGVKRVQKLNEHDSLGLTLDLKKFRLYQPTLGSCLGLERDVPAYKVKHCITP